ncbi:MAG: DUF815 domain-containing protein [Candidatus Gastranaerophilales bacterium]|nr:DUF815 domain-containing protein [Candidatus Gastranaerophilales bacterium]
MEKIKEIYCKTFFLIHFKKIKENHIVKSFIDFLEALFLEQDFIKTIKKYSDFVELLNNEDFSLYIKENLPDIEKNENSNNELKIICELSKINYELIKDILYKKYPNYGKIIDILPYFNNSGLDLELKDIKTKANSRTFIFDENLKLKALDIKEPLSFSDLKGYEKQKKILYDNTKALLDNKHVNNILLYGDAGCGKSTSVRALLNEFENIKIVQVFKNNLINIDKLYEILRQLKDKFIIFADDISFDEDDRDLSTMKAVLEGSLIQCPKNAVIYATSNRRHLIRETFQSRKGDEVHLNDTLNEINSLAERFGINLLFAKPNNEEFIDIVLKLASEYSIDMEPEIIIQKAQRLALIKGSKSPRIARQLIDNLRNNMDI